MDSERRDSLSHDMKIVVKMSRQLCFWCQSQRPSKCTVRSSGQSQWQAGVIIESALKVAGLDVTGADAHVTNPTDGVESMSLSR